MKEINTLALAGMVIGFLFSFFSAIRYFLLWYDLDRALVYIVIGALIMSVSYLYNKIKKQEEKNKEQDEDIFKVTGWIEDFESKKLKGGN